jgi:hypothetical protein
MESSSSGGRDLRAQMAEFEMTVHNVLERRNSGLEPQNNYLNRRNSGFEQRLNSNQEYQNNALQRRNSGFEPQNALDPRISGFEWHNSGLEYRQNVMEHQNSGFEPQQAFDRRNSGFERRNNVPERQNSNFEDFWIRDFVAISSPASTIAPSPQARNSPSPIPIVPPFTQVVQAENVNKRELKNRPLSN